MEMIEQTLRHTPWWVFLLLAYVLRIGIKGLHPRTVEFRKLAVVPAIFAVWGLHSVYQLLGLNPPTLAVLAASIAMGGVLGWQLSRTVEIKAVGDGKAELSGSPVTLVLVLTIFLTKYALGFWMATDPQARTTMAFATVDAGVTGLVVGMFAGRFASLYARYEASKAALMIR